MVARRGDAGTRRDFGGRAVEDEPLHFVDDAEEALSSHRGSPGAPFISDSEGETGKVIGDSPADDIKPTRQRDGDDAVELREQREAGTDQRYGEPSVLKERRKYDLGGTFS